VVTIGSAIVAYSLFMMADLSLAVDFWTILASRFVQGLGMGMVFVPLTTMSLAAVPAHRMATATGIFNLVRNLGASVGIAVLTTRLARQGQIHHSYLAEHATRWNPATTDRLATLERAFRASGVDATTAHDQALQHLAGEVSRQATMQAFVDNYTMLAWLFVLFVPMVWGMARPTRHPPEGAIEVAEAIEPP
jgi:DHA2 family multidrug resistance protein